ncbi:MAG: HEAT repeat domain-containing protein [Trichodesmium sp. St5_bin8]|nr:HEAT repeat domain-containing protein [Trichodesmium sp. St5_bin8]
MIEWLITWGSSEAVKCIANEVIGVLAKGAAEDYVKDFFKQSFSDAFGRIANGEPLKKATKQAIKDFLDLGYQELKNAELSESELNKYSQYFKSFIKEGSVLEVLISAFDNKIKILDTHKLAISWKQINPPLPDNFDWEFLAKQHQRNVKNIIRDSQELRSILDSKNLEEIVNKDIKIRPEFNLKKYQEGILEQYGNLKLESLDTTGYSYNELKLWKMFIPQNVRESQEFIPQIHEIPKEYLSRLRDTKQLEAELSQEQLKSLRRRYFEQQTHSVLELIEYNNYKYLVILGDPGSGKSTLLQYIALQWAELPLKDLSLNPIPLLIELRTYVRNHNENKCNSFLDFLEKGSGVSCHLPQEELHAKLQSGNAIMMFDGLDEVFDPAKREQIITDIHRFTNDYKNVQVIVTSRVIGYKPQKLRDAEFYHFILQDLESEQIENFIQRWHDLTYQDEREKERKRERLKRAIKDSSAIKQLSENPLLLTMMAILNRHQELPRDRTELYHQASRILLQQWDMERALIDRNLNPMTIDYKDKQAILRQVAFFMQENKAGLAGNLIHGNDLEKIIRAYLKSEDINDPKTVARALMEQLRSRNFILCFVGAEYYAFVHRTFLEYFCAWSFVWLFEKEQKMSPNRLIEEVFGQHWQDEKWHEVLRLIVGMIDTKFARKIIYYLMEQDGEEKKFLNLFLAGKCLFEVRNNQNISFSDIGYRLLNKLKHLTGYDLGYSYEEYDNYSKEIYQKNAALVCEIRTQAVHVVATTWIDEGLTYTWLKQRVKSDNDQDVRREALRQIATGWKHQPGILALLKQRVVSDNDQDVRREAVRQIATGWKHQPGIFDLLKQWVFSDENSDVRREALRQIATGWKHQPEIFDLLKQRVESDENWDVRCEAVRQIATVWKHQPGIFDLLKQWVVSDDDPDVRREALRQIATGWKHQPGIFDLIKQRVVSDDDWYVRVEALRQIATGWKHQPIIFDLLKQRVESDDDPNVRREAARQIAAGWKHQPIIFDLLKQKVESDENWDVRCEAVRQIATGWKHQPGTFDLLKQWVDSDHSSTVRREAVRQIATGWKHEPEILDLLKERVSSDHSSTVRREAVRQIAAGWKHEPEILDLLKERVSSDHSSTVRREAVRQIAAGWKHEPEILDLLKERVSSDHSSTVRGEALRQIVTGWKHEPGIFELFYHTALNDPFQREEYLDKNPRQIVLAAIVKQYPDHPQIIPLLQDRVANDPDEQLRDWAKKKLQRLENS